MIFVEKWFSSKSLGFQNQFENSNTTGSYFVKGIDVLINKTFKKTMLWASYSYADNRYNFKSLAPSSFHNNLDITNTLAAGASYSIHRINISTQLSWYTGKPFTEPALSVPQENGTIRYAFPNAQRIRDYVRVAFSALYKFKILPGISGLAGFSVWNILNRENQVRSFL